MIATSIGVILGYWLDRCDPDQHLGKFAIRFIKIIGYVLGTIAAVSSIALAIGFFIALVVNFPVALLIALFLGLAYIAYVVEDKDMP